MTDKAALMAKELGIGAKKECVRVVVRVRPISSKESQSGYRDIADVNENSGSIRLVNPNSEDRDLDKTFTFDSTFSGKSTQKEVYEKTAAYIVDNVLEGYNGTIFCYGQTGSGKTHTMEGYPDPTDLKGIMPRAFKHIFDSIGVDDSSHNKQFLVRGSYLEIYNENVKDLLSNSTSDKLEIKENSDSGVYVKDLSSIRVYSITELEQLLQQGKSRRATAETNMNLTSSRSHSIFTVIVEQSTKNVDGTEHYRVGKLNLVDLAGSERVSKTGAKGDRLTEGININQSLSTLGNVIKSLVDGKSTHVPYRDSKLTRLLQDSLGGNTKTCMVANCGPTDYNYEETLSTLRYADRAKRIKNKPSINEDPKDAMLRQFQEEISRLKQLLARQGGMADISGNNNVYYNEDGTQVIEKVVVKEVEISQEKVLEIQRQVEEEGKKELDMIEQQLEATKFQTNALSKELRDQAQREKEQLEMEKTKILKEREELQTKLRNEAMEIDKERSRKETYFQKLKNLEDRLIQGGELKDKVAKQELELRRVQIDLQEKERVQRQLQEQLEKEAEEKSLYQQKYTSLEAEIVGLNSQIEKATKKFKKAINEYDDIQNEINNEKNENLEKIRSLNRENSLYQIIISSFIPVEERNYLEEHAIRTKNNGYEMPPFDINLYKNNLQKLQCDPQLRRPLSRFTKERQLFDMNPRYHYDNIVQLDLDLGERTTMDYQPGFNEAEQSTLDQSNQVPYLEYPEDRPEKKSRKKRSGK